MNYKSYVTEELLDGSFKQSFKELSIEELHTNDVLIKVKWSSLNYKDALSAKGHKGITRYYPHTAGVDAAGVVEKTNTDEFEIGEEVLVTGHDLGMNTNGGFAEYVSVPKDWVVKLGNGLTLRESMIYGTAGITAAICIDQLIKHNLEPNKSTVLVTGATGGVGSMSIAILNKIGFDVIASTGKLHKTDFLKSIGANEVIHREEVYDTTNKPLLKRRWDGAIDTVGGNTLSTVIRSTNHHGSVCVVGLVESPDLKLNVFPFLQRGVSVLGIDSAERGINVKRKLWKKLANEWKPDCLNDMVREVNLLDIQTEIDSILEGKQIGKTLINCKI